MSFLDELYQALRYGTDPADLAADFDSEMERLRWWQWLKRYHMQRQRRILEIAVMAHWQGRKVGQSHPVSR